MVVGEDDQIQKINDETKQIINSGSDEEKKEYLINLKILIESFT